LTPVEFDRKYKTSFYIRYMYKIGFNVLKNDIAMEVKHQSCMNKKLKEIAG
jgi:hypothetical protein